MVLGINNKKGTNPMIALIMVLVLCVFGIIVIGNTFGLAFFGSPAHEATERIYEEIEDVCKAHFMDGDEKEFSVKVPYKTGDNTKAKYYYLSISNIEGQAKELRLNSRNFIPDMIRNCDGATTISGGECLDVRPRFAEWAKDNPNQNKLAAMKFKNCADWTICVKSSSFNKTALSSRCGEFSFEPNKDKEALYFTLKKDTTHRKIYIDYSRDEALY
jgi:hypothetical protein